MSACLGMVATALGHGDGDGGQSSGAPQDAAGQSPVWSEVALFAVVVAVSAALPGPDTMLLFSRALGFGARSTVALTSGLTLGKLVLLASPCRPRSWDPGASVPGRAGLLLRLALTVVMAAVATGYIGVARRSRSALSSGRRRIVDRVRTVLLGLVGAVVTAR